MMRTLNIGRTKSIYGAAKLRHCLVRIQITVICALIVIVLHVSCSNTRLMSLSKKEIAGLDTVYSSLHSGKLYDTEYIFYKKQIFQMKTHSLRTKTYTGTWSERNDTISVYIFYKDVADRQFIMGRETGKISLIQE